MTIREMEKMVWGLAENAVNLWFDEQMKNPYASFYLYYKPQGNHLIIATDCPSGYELGSSERISPAWTKEAAVMKVNKMTKRLPMLDV